jgi:DNA-binding NtrC family response regulator
MGRARVQPERERRAVKDLRYTRKRDTTSSPSTEQVPAPFLFLMMECDRPRAAGARYGLGDLDEVLLGRGTTREARREGRRLIVCVPDPLMSSNHARLFRSQVGWEIEDTGSTNGTFLYGRRTTHAPLSGGELIELGGTFLSVSEALVTPASAEAATEVDGVSLPGREHGFATLLPHYQRALASLVQVAVGNLPVLLLGESGTGKEVLARGIHQLSGRRGPFVPVNCGAIPESLVEGQLFGHVKGAFSGAQRDEPGFIRSSDGGTLMLDEIGDLPRTSQAALLRVLQEREVVPVGSTRAVKVNLRVVAATHRQVDALAGDGFRADLYARLSGFVHKLPPLRERRCDIGMIVAHLLDEDAPGRDVRIGPALGRALLSYDWPLNVRELRHVLEAALLLTDGVLELRHVPDALRGAAEPAFAPAGGSGVTRASSVPPADDERRTRLATLLESTGGNVSEVARAMGTTRMQIHRWMRRYGVDAAAYRDK